MAAAVPRTAATFITVVALMMATVGVVVVTALVVVVPAVVAAPAAPPPVSRFPLPAADARRGPGRTGRRLPARSGKRRGREPERGRPLEAAHGEDAHRVGDTGSRIAPWRERHRPHARHGLAGARPPVATLTDQSGLDGGPRNEQQREGDEQRGGEDERGTLAGPPGTTHLPDRCMWRRGHLWIQSLGEGTLDGLPACEGRGCAPRAPFASQSSLHHLSQPGRPQCRHDAYRHSMP